MLDFILALLEFEQLSSIIILLMFVGIGWFWAIYAWPWLTSGIDKWANGWLELKRLELRAQVERDEKFANAWQEHSKELRGLRDVLIEQGQVTRTMVEAQKALISTLLSFVDDRKLQDRLYKIFYDEGQ